MFYILPVTSTGERVIMEFHFSGQSLPGITHLATAQGNLSQDKELSHNTKNCLTRQGTISQE
jgi:hypothetical protein